MKHRLIQAAGLAGAAALVTMTASPGYAATIVSQASANAINLSLAGNNVPVTKGDTTATNDGTGEKVTGITAPIIGVLQGQSLLNIGVLAQSASAKVNGLDGVSAACSGIAGKGATVVAVGESNCLSGGDPVGLSVTNLNLTGVNVINPESALGPLAQANPLLADILGQITAPLSAALNSALGNIGIGGGLGAVQSRCNASPGVATGSANIADSKLTLTVPGVDPVTLVELPVNPPPNLKPVVNLELLTETILDGVEVQLKNGLDGLAAGLQVITDPLQTEIIAPLVNQLRPLLQAVQANLLDITLNEQPAHPADQIQVTALVLKLLPTAPTGPLVDLRVAKVTCGPNGRIAPPPAPPGLPEIPTVVDAGANGSTFDLGDGVIAAGLLLLAGAAGLGGYRRLQNS